MSEECIPDVAKVQIVDSLTQWSNKRREQLARLEQDPAVDKEWLQAHKEVLSKVENATNAIVSAKDCPEEEASPVVGE